jgi:hypothetical protein
MQILNSASKIAMLSVVFAHIILTALQIEVTEPLKSLALMIVGYYFGGKNNAMENDTGTRIDTTKDDNSIT